MFRILSMPEKLWFNLKRWVLILFGFGIISFGRVIVILKQSKFLTR